MEQGALPHRWWGLYVEVRSAAGLELDLSPVELKNSNEIWAIQRKHPDNEDITFLAMSTPQRYNS